MPAEHARRSYATYGGVYIAAALIRLWVAKGVRPDRWDLLGAAVCLTGSGSILLPLSRPRALPRIDRTAEKPSQLRCLWSRL
ncbi:YnfA family protein [Brevundimonas bacteroides]|uniref:hypothetical protein n=1 Tax=Brevundimonas bacteroides TaxID=74311 RepID=UPI000A05B4A7